MIPAFCPDPMKKLAKSVEDIEKLVKKSDRKKSRVERKARKEKLRAKRLEVDTYDLELKKDFAETERRIIEKKLSKEKLKKHREFVKEIERETAELKKHLKAIEDARDDLEEDRELDNFNAYIKRVKVEKKRPKIDFNNLPHRNAEPTKLKPRLKKEEFESVQKAKLFTPHEGYAFLHPGKDLSVEGYHPVNIAENYTVAAIGPVAEFLPAEPEVDLSLMSVDELTSSPMLMAAASDLPTAGDLAPTIDVQMTDAVIAKAAELGNDPLKIYEWVRNNIEFAPTWGSIQGADYCLQTKLCNSFDTASLMIAMLRASKGKRGQVRL